MPKNDSPFITTGERVRSFLGWAILISIAIHFVFAPFLKNMTQATESQTVEKVSVTKKIVVKPPTPPPTPKPTPTPPPQKKVQPKVQPNPRPMKLNVVKTHNTSTGTTTETKYVAPKTGSENGVPNTTGTAAPATPAASTGPPETPHPACKTPYQDATVVQQSQPDYPDSARELGLGTVTVSIEVTIAPSGSLETATVSQSSNNAALDNAAVAAAKQSTYAPKIVNCTPVEGQYLFKVTFDPNS